MTGARNQPTENSWTTRQVVLATLFVVSVFLIFLLLFRLRAVVFLFFVAVVIGTAIRPAVDWLFERGIRRPVGIIAIYILLGLFITGFLALLLPLAADQVTQILQDLPAYYSEARQYMLGSGNRVLQNIGFRLPAIFGAATPSPEPTTEEMLLQVNRTLEYAGLTLRGFLSTLAIFLLAFYWTQESGRAIRTLLRLVPENRRNSVRSFIDEAELRLGGFIRGQGILSLVVGAAAFVAYTLIGLPYALVLGIIAGLLEMVPVFGPALGAVPALLVALTVDPVQAVWVLVATAIIQAMENAWLVPRIMKASMGVNPIIVLLSLVTFGTVLGVAGAVLAIPLAAVVQMLLDRALSAEQSRLASENGANSTRRQDEEDSSQALSLPFSPEPAPEGLTESEAAEFQALYVHLENLLDAVKAAEEPQ